LNNSVNSIFTQRLYKRQSFPRIFRSLETQLHFNKLYIPLGILLKTVFHKLDQKYEDKKESLEISGINRS